MAGVTQVSWSQPKRAPRLSPKVDECRDLIVRAWMQQGAVLDEQWPITLDGILAGIARRQRLGRVYGTEIDHHVDPLPIARFDPPSSLGLGQVGKQWHWMASCARPHGVSARELHWWHGRFDEQRASYMVSNLPPIVRPNQGRYRSYRSPLVITVCAALEWHVTGLADELLALCQQSVCIGKKHAQGEGLVIRWEVIDHGPPTSLWHMWWEDGRVARPVTARLAPTFAPSAQIVDAALRPPYFQGKRLRPALAPWAMREEASVAVPKTGDAPRGA